jgi:uncharacterized membrane protein
MSPAEIVSSSPPPEFADRVRHVGSDEPFRWLAAGWRDLRAAGGASLCYGLIFVGAGLVLLLAAMAANMMYLFFPLAAGFMLVGPAATLGFYAISRALERRETPSFAVAVTAFRANHGPLLYVGLALLCLLLLWLRLAQLVFALSFPVSAGLDPQVLLNATLFTADGRVFLALIVVMGAVIAGLVFAGGAFALPMLLDRPVGMVDAVATSWTAVMTNIPAMIVWAAILVVLTAAGMAVGFIGLAVTLPLTGHATWHAYRAVVR